MPDFAPIDVIPAEQQPLSQYQELCESGFFRWPCGSWLSFGKGILGLWLGSWVVTGTIAAGSFPLPQHWGRFGIVASVAASGLVLLVLLRLYLGWQYVQQRLLKPQIIYEESGWYDSALYEKSEQEQQQQQLIAQHEISPTLKRIRQAVAGLIGLSLGLLACWTWA